MKKPLGSRVIAVELFLVCLGRWVEVIEGERIVSEDWDDIEIVVSAVSPEWAMVVAEARAQSWGYGYRTQEVMPLSRQFSICCDEF